MRHRVAHESLVSSPSTGLPCCASGSRLAAPRAIRPRFPSEGLRPVVERLISIAKRSGSDEGNGKALFARRLVSRDLHDPDVVKKLFDTLAPRYVDRPGGYTRLLKLGHRRGDNAEVAQVELVGSEYNAKAAADKDARQDPCAKPKGMGGR